MSENKDMKKETIAESGRKGKGNALKRIGWILFLVTIPIVSILFFTERYLMTTWGELTVDEILYHLKTSIKGTNPEMVRDAVIRYGIPAVILCAVIFAAIFFLRKKSVPAGLIVGLVLAAEFACLFYLKTDMDRRLNFTSYVVRRLQGANSDFIRVNYADPKEVKMKFPKKKKNLVFIYLESLEMTYADTANGGAFSENVIPKLTELAHENEDFSGSDTKLNGGVSLPGSTWTMGAMFAYSTGAPLKIPLHGNKMKDRDSFFPGMSSIGTVLEKEGYNQELLIGSDAGFGGRDVFYKSHGNYKIEDYISVRENGRLDKNYKAFWGFEDEKLFKFGREDIKRLAKEKKPFNMTMLTVDTHFEDGYHCRLCKDEFGEQYADAFACSDRQVTKFVKWIQKQDFYKDTTIVLCGDHPTMDRDFCKNVPEDYQRKTYIAIINGQPEESESAGDKAREYSTFDLFPTTLAAMGVRIQGNRLGLGTNLYSKEKTLIEQYGIKKCQQELDMPSKFMDEMSGITLTEKTLKTVARRAKIEVEYPEGKDGKPDKNADKVTLRVINIHRSLSDNAIKGMELEVKDKETGEVSTYRAESVHPNKNDVNVYVFEVEMPLKGKKLSDYDGTFYIYIEGISHYKIADFESDLKEE